MQNVQELEATRPSAGRALLPVSVIIPTRNEARNLPRCLESLGDVAEVYVIDSQSTDSTCSIARQHGAKVVQFHYQGGWPKKRQWAMDNLPLTCDWVLLLDADEALTPELVSEMRSAIESGDAHGYYIALQLYFLGRRLRFGDANFWKLPLFRRDHGRFECRIADQNASMGDVEIHEHVVVDGPTRKFKNRIVHHNVNSLSHYIQKHNEYSNWEARVWSESGRQDELRPDFWGTQAQRRRWLRTKCFRFPGSPVMFFLYKYIWRAGFLDGIPGLIYCCFQGIQFFHIKAKIYELRKAKSGACAESAV
jgi:glycosyltransferase involved in cell wall biosynthesis